MTTKYVQNWFARAEEDLALVILILKKGTGSPNLACFHAQQAAEKYLKGFLAHHDLHVRKIHDVEMLRSESEKADPAFTQLQTDAIFLNQFYIESRYPDDFIAFERKDAEKALAAALRIKEFVLTRVAQDKQNGFGVGAVIIALATVILLGGGL